MLDPYQLPVLLKAIDFVFDEGRKILEERRERRQLNETAQNSADQEPVEPVKEIPAPAPEPEKEVETKQDLLASKIDELLWRNHEWEVESLVKQLETHTRNYHMLREQYAKYGSADVRPITVHNLIEAENSIIETKKRLEIILSKVYKKDIHPNK